MKKILSLAVALTMLVGIVFTGCSSNTGDTAKKAAGTGKKNIKVGFLYVGPIGDGGYTYAHDQGRKYLEKQLGVPTVYKESVKEDSSEVQKAAEDMINQGCNVIFGTSFGFMDGMAAEAKKHPEVTFMHCSGYKTADNLGTYYGRMYQVRYLTGIIAGMKTKTNKIGYVGAFPIPEVIRDINAFTLGVQSVNKDAAVKVVWTNTWYDPAKEKEAAKALLAQGADIISQHQDTAGPQQAAEEAGAFSIGYDTDMKDKAPKAVMTSAVWNWGPYYVKTVKAIQDGTWKSDQYFGTINDGIVQLTPLTSNAPAGAQAAVDKAKADIESGKNKIFAGPLKDQTGAVKVPDGKVMTDKELLNFDWFVQGVEGKISK